MVEPTTVPHGSRSLPVQGLRLEVTRGPDLGKVALATSGTITIGTAPGNDLVLTDDTVSRYHAELSHRGDRILVVDHGSTNGTLSGSVAINSATVAPGTVLTLGRTSIRVEDSAMLEIEVYDDDQLADLRGRSPHMLALMAQVKRIARSDASVLLLGETGAGKEVVARAIHELSPRSEKPFETVDCGALAPTLIASELFGHERGAFTGADQQHIGAFERAHGGTLFLDEIGELPQQLQATLLGALERRSFRRLGGKSPIDVEVRVICATNRDLRAEVNEGTFRQDLYYRIAVLLLRIPPLRDRGEDIPLLIEHFAREAGYSGNIDELVPPSAMEGLLHHRWPGNVRELRNFVEAALAFGVAPKIEDLEQERDPSRFPSLATEQLVEMSFKTARSLILDEFEKIYLSALLERCRDNVSEAARVSEIHRSYFNRMLRRHGLR